MSNPSKQKGTAMETMLKQFFIDNGFDADRLTLHGSKDVGDVKVYGIPAVFEVKNCKKLELSKWISETLVERDNAGKRWGFCVFKRARSNVPEKQFVLMELGQLVEILGELYPEAKQ